MSADNIDKLIKLVKGRGFTTETQVRNYLKTRIPDKETIDIAVKKLSDAKLISLDEVKSESKSEVKSEPKSEIKSESKSESKPVSFPAYKKAIAQFFKTRQPMPRVKMKLEMSFKLDWFTPKDSDIFIQFCERDGLLVEKDGLMSPTFDPSSVDLPDDWSLHRELNIKTGHEIAQETRSENDLNKAIEFVQEEKKGEVQKMMLMDGIEKDATEVFTVSDVEDMTPSFRNEFKMSVVRKLSNLGLSSKCSNGLFDYFELNYGLLDVETFIMNSAQFEGFSDDKCLRKAYEVLTKENWR